MDLSTVILRPVISEKSYGLAEGGVYTFLVAPEANKTQIRQAVEALFDVKVAKVNTLNREGKRKRNRRKPTFGKRPDRKRAYVTLVEGERKIELFQS